jgi:GAF domain-containing protein
LLYALPRQRDVLFPLLKEEFSDLADVDERADVPQEIPSQFLMEVLDTRATIPDALRFWAITRLVLQHALRQLDVENVGMAITVVRCMPPSSGGRIRSLRESLGQGTPPWEGDLEQKAIFLGAESLAGYVVTTGRPAAVDDLREEATLLPAYQTEHEVSAAAHPILYANRIAGCLLFSSTQPNYFLSSSRLLLIRGYTHLISLAFDPMEFYEPQLIQLGVMPPLEVQRKYLAGFRKLVLKLMRDSTGTPQPLTNFQAEQLAWQQLEETLLQLPPQGM